MKTFVIVGGNFSNTGASAMTYITVSKLREKYPDCRIYMISNAESRKKHENLRFDVIGMSYNSMMLISRPSLPRFAKAVLKYVTGKNNDFHEVRHLGRIIKECDGVFDISGYAISSQWGLQLTEFYTEQVTMFASRGIPYYFMPQSFGPFDYEVNREKTVERLGKALDLCACVFAREDEGYRLLKEITPNERLMKSADMVLQTEKIELNSIFNVIPEVEAFTLETTDNVAVIPNMRNFDHGNAVKILSIYKAVVQKLLANNKTIYLISHSSEDMDACCQIKACFRDRKEVILLEGKIDALNFGKFIRQFDFAIASRFHSIVHAYKEGIPCIALGWATKYHELLDSVGQSEYIFDVRAIDGPEKIISAVEKMNSSFREESRIIKEHVKEIQRNNCFDLIDF